MNRIQEMSCWKGNSIIACFFVPDFEETVLLAELFKKQGSPLSKETPSIRHVIIDNCEFEFFEHVKIE